jgi:hypothetical protein
MTTTPQRRRRQPNSAQVSRALADAGYVKAAPYSPSGRAHEGFLVIWNDRFPPGGGLITRVVKVMHSRSVRPSDEAAATMWHTRYAEALEAAGYRVGLEKRQNGSVRTVRVLPWDETPPRRQPVATRVAAALQAAGHRRAQNASSRSGFLAVPEEGEAGREVYVLSAGNYLDPDRSAELLAWAEALTAAGYRVEPQHEDPVRRDEVTSLRVLRWEA